MQRFPYWRLSAYYFAYFAFSGVYSPYFGLYLQSPAFSAWDIGLLMSQVQLTRVFGPYLWGLLADRSGQRLQIVRLSEESRLLSADYQQLRQDLAKALGKNYLDHQDYTLTPAESRYLPSMPLDEQTRYLGVIAHYADPQRAQWRQLIRIDPVGHHYQLLVRLQSDRILLQREEE